MVTDNHSECWICDKHIYTLLLWNKSIGFQDQSDISMSDIDAMVKQIEIHNKDV